MFQDIKYYLTTKYLLLFKESSQSIMSPLRPFLIAACLGASCPSWAEVATAQPVPTDAPAELPKATDSMPLATDVPAAVPSSNVTVNLINRLVQKGILTQPEALELIKQAQADAAIAAQNAAAADAPVPAADELRVSYIPEVVRNQMRDQIKQDLMAQAREDKWSVKPSADWTSKFRPYGDIRVRYDGTFFPAANDNTFGAFPNFNAINTVAPYDRFSNQLVLPQYNVDQNRQRARLYARLGTEIMLGEGFNAGLCLGTGDSNTPTSLNQTLGGSGGNFSKYQLWLDKAFVSYDAGPGDGEELTFFLGRFANPFFCTDVQWDPDLGFDGAALRGKVKLTDNVSTFFTAGAFPVYNTDFNFASNQSAKFTSTDKWLAGAQLGIDWKINKDLAAKVALSYYDFHHIEGRLSSPFTPLNTSDAGNTDTTRPGFAQRGNTYMELRNIVLTPATTYPSINSQYQYYGLATPFRNLTLTGKLDYDHFEPLRVSLLGEVTKNVAYNNSAISQIAVNNFAPIENGGNFAGGDLAWNLAFQVGNPALEAFGEWQAGVGYRYVESDAIVDGFTDSDFGGGGTNLKGFTLGGKFALSKAVYCGLRWMSSNEIAGPPLKSDTLQIDLHAKF